MLGPAASKMVGDPFSEGILAVGQRLESFLHPDQKTVPIDLQAGTLDGLPAELLESTCVCEQCSCHMRDISEGVHQDDAAAVIGHGHEWVGVEGDGDSAHRSGLARYAGHAFDPRRPQQDLRRSQSLAERVDGLDRRNPMHLHVREMRQQLFRLDRPPIGLDDGDVGGLGRWSGEGNGCPGSDPAHRDAGLGPGLGDAMGVRPQGHAEGGDGPEAGRQTDGIDIHHVRVDRFPVRKERPAPQPRRSQEVHHASSTGQVEGGQCPQVDGLRDDDHIPWVGLS